MASYNLTQDARQLRKPVAFVAAMIVFIIMLMVLNTGCSYLKAIDRATDELNARYGESLVLVDEDGDSVPDAAAFDRDNDNVPDIDEHGRAMVIPESREMFRAAQASDASIGEILSLLGYILPWPLGGAAVWWARKKPLQRAEAAAWQLRDVVASVEDFKTWARMYGKEGEEAYKALKAALKRQDVETSESVDLILREFVGANAYAADEIQGSIEQSR